jgi:hypothetical protein
MERFLHVFDEKFGVDANEFFMEGIIFMMYYSTVAVIEHKLNFYPCVFAAS